MSDTAGVIQSCRGIRGSGDSGVRPWSSAADWRADRRRPHRTPREQEDRRLLAALTL